ASNLNGITIPCGASFSFNEIVGPRTEAYGYQRAANGRGVRVTGGGVAQCATTLYLALEQLGADVEYTSLLTYGSKFSDNYVSDGSDAIMVDYSSGSDFSFINCDDDMRIEMWTTENYLYCAITLEPVVNMDEDADDFLEWLPSAPLQSGLEIVASASIRLSDDENLRNNVSLAADSINDTVLSPGDLFSFNDTVGPRSERYGYKSAVNGRGAKVTGGGVAQVASALWLAVKHLGCVAVVEKSTYGSRYNQDYVASSNDAILTDYANGTDFSFRNTGSQPLTISTRVSGDTLHCTIYRG
ncbi:MAG: VanW family protein, partial [Aristaeellaceae bacterium]